MKWNCVQDQKILNAVIKCYFFKDTLTVDLDLSPALSFATSLKVKLLPFLSGELALNEVVAVAVLDRLTGLPPV